MTKQQIIIAKESDTLVRLYVGAFWGAPSYRFESVRQASDFAAIEYPDAQISYRYY